MTEVDQIVQLVSTLPFALPANSGLLYLLSAAGNFVGHILPLDQMLFWLVHPSLNLGA